MGVKPPSIRQETIGCCPPWEGGHVLEKAESVLFVSLKWQRARLKCFTELKLAIVSQECVKTGHFFNFALLC